MKISAILEDIDNGRVALPEFQRGYVWSPSQVRGLFTSLYRQYPIGGLLVWDTESETAAYRGDAPISPGRVNLLLDGQQRVTSLYGVARGHAPDFFDGNANAFTGLLFHLEDEIFNFQSVTTKSDLWVNVTDVLKGGNRGLHDFMGKHAGKPVADSKYVPQLMRLLGIMDTDVHISRIGTQYSVEEVVEIFNQVNSRGTPLSQGDLALAKICANWPDMRNEMKKALANWQGAGYRFTFDWLLRSVNTVLTGEAKFQFLRDKSAQEMQMGLRLAVDKIDQCLNMIGGRLGLDHDRVLFARPAIPVMVRYLMKQDEQKRDISAEERDRLLFWFLQSGIWGRFSGSTETAMNQDINAIDKDGVNGLLKEAARNHKLYRVGAEDFDVSSVGARIYPALYFLARTGKAIDWGTGDQLSADLLGRNSSLEKHHIFPRAQLKKRDFARGEINALANFCFLTKRTNLKIRDRLPEKYFPEIEESHPGALASQWIPQDEKLWKAENYLDFLDARRELIAAEMNNRLAGLLHDECEWLDAEKTFEQKRAPGGVGDDAERAELEKINKWVKDNGFSSGIVDYEHSDKEGVPLVILDLAWPKGLQEGLDPPIALLLNETEEVSAIARLERFLCFDSVGKFKKYVQKEYLE